MSARIIVTAGTKVHVGPQTTATPADASAWAALTPWTEIVNLEDIGELAINRQQINVSVIGDMFVRTFGGAQEPGAWALSGTWSPGDDGQAIIATAVNQNLLYPFRITFADRLNAQGTDSVIYIHGQVLSYPVRPGGNQDVVRTTINVGIVAPLVFVAATSG